MRRISHARVVAVAVALLLISGSAVLAGSGVGGVFNLGVSNTVNKVTALKGAATTPLLRVTNDGSGPALSLQVKNPGTAPILLDAESTGKVVNLNADMLDGRDATQFINGKGAVTSYAIALSAGGISPVIWGPTNDAPEWSIGYVCPSNLATNGTIRILANFPGPLNLFLDQGLSDPEYIVLPNNVEITRPTNKSGEWVHMQMQSPAGWIADIDLFSVHRANDCHIQSVALTTLP
jgi:hypothetical protein